jgi:periplasmic divalent cation tolerance protein
LIYGILLVSSYHPIMKATHRHLAVLVTTPDLKTARILAREALKARLIACANLIPRMESHYWWQGRLECGPEILLVMKTAPARLAALEQLVLAHHPYDTPEIIALPVAAGNARYLAWWSKNVTVE